ncbi:substrate-binding domain-containing protein [Rhizobiales bacterium]|uniref:LacI family DNA-binding transcriptional regulator n=1 Tax=Hongsoonwoonella zoysiae TaxID=2821844 RepID=UPI00155FB956|nr:substrate-binding domain-containing protein [Hongsoonwoonella zoysiae]NRG19959.1 substrate-binding domain-containing protein [Hongsoonwoonella zoysiae]
MTKTTIHDVAARAGVSLATVDRVLNRRPGVRPQTIAKVEAAAQELNYRPDPYAASLAKKRSDRFLFLLPEGRNPFMQQLAREALATADRVLMDRVTLSVRHVDTFDKAALASALSQIDPAEYEGVAVVAQDAPVIRQAIDALRERGVHVVTLISDVATAGRDHFVGVDNVAAGRVAGRLIGRFLPQAPGKVALICGTLALSDHAQRVEGCRAVLEADYPYLEVLPVREGRDDDILTRETASNLLKSEPELVGLYNVGSGTRGLIASLEANASPGKPVTIAHELTPHAAQALEAGTLDALICQDPGHEIRSAARVLKALVDNTAIVKGQERIRIEIYIRENLPFGFTG